MLFLLNSQMNATPFYGKPYNSILISPKAGYIL